ncbi:CMF_collapsed_G0013510.mRNA.1.CDS.1 [Saccharomyces cerevisiae]|nr:CMF_collapsed_G0013510.mRNA.1.CDS.1 [Saccharomyces cerevisiae]
MFALTEMERFGSNTFMSDNINSNTIQRNVSEGPLKNKIFITDEDDLGDIDDKSDRTIFSRAGSRNDFLW